MNDDDEFVYVDATSCRPELARFDVYRATNRAQLGHVVKFKTHVWKAVDPDSRDEVRGRSRAAAVLGLWGTR